MIEVNTIYNESNVDTCKRISDNFVDLVVTSPPYDSLRNYNGYTFEFDTLAHELYRILKPGGVLVWVVGDATIGGTETGTSFRQALYFMDCGFLLHDTMIYQKNSSAFPAKPDSKRYTQIFEYMFVFTKGKIRNDIHLLCDKPNKWAGHTNWGKLTYYSKDGKDERDNKIKPVPEFSLRNNIWTYTTSCEKDRTGHPAVFPEQLAQDHILSWSNAGDIVYDPFMGSGTTAKMCILNNRKYIGSEISEEYYKIIMERLNIVEKYDGKVSYNVNKKEKTKKEDGEVPLF
jgi:site-specific DNA-methyltransferase (adenine-specific)